MSLSRAVNKISSCQANTTSRRGVGGIKQLGISFGCISFLFSYERSWGWIYSWKLEENRQPPALMTALLRLVNTITAWENSWHFMTPTLVFPRNDMWDMSAEIPYWWPRQCFWLVLLYGKFASAYQKHYPDLASDASSVGECWACFSDVIMQGNQWWHSSA